MKTYYELLAVEPTASPEEVKRAFRREIARYHPDKVQHLGPEFQDIAATRAAELTEAYRVLMDPAGRRAYDETLARGEAPSSSGPSDTAREPAARKTPDYEPPSATPREPEPDVPHVSETLRRTQETMSGFVRKATIARVREAVDAVFPDVQALASDGFDASFLVKAKRGMFQKADPPIHLLIKIVARVDGASIEEAWPQALKPARNDATVCLMMLGLGLAPSRELASVIAAARRRTRTLAPVVVPVDTRDWDALLPPETPQGVRKLLDRLKLGD